MKKKVYHSTKKAPWQSEIYEFFNRSIDGNMRFAVVAFLVVGLLFLLWQQGMFRV